MMWSRTFRVACLECTWQPFCIDAWKSVREPRPQEVEGAATVIVGHAMYCERQEIQNEADKQTAEMPFVVERGTRRDWN